MFKVKDKVVVNGINQKYKGTIVSISYFREPSVRYAVNVPEIDDVIFVGENQIQKVVN